MKSRIFYLLLFTLGSQSFFAKGQEQVVVDNEKKLYSGILNSGNDSLLHKQNTRAHQYMLTGVDSSNAFKAILVNTAICNEIGQLKHRLQYQIDSLGEGGEKVTGYSKAKVLGFDTVFSMENTVKEKVNEVQLIGTGLDLDPIGNGLTPAVSNPILTITGLPPDLDKVVDISDVKLAKSVNTNLPTEKILEKDLNSINGKFPANLDGLRDNPTGLNKRAGDLTKNTEEFDKELRIIKEEGMTKSEKLPELAEQQALKIDEVKAVHEQQVLATKQMDEYKKLIEQYKDEKKILAELKEKARDQATEVVSQNAGKVNESMKKIGKYSRKFPQVQDMRNLPKRAPNPLKDLSWRERLVPGLTFQTLTHTTTWLELDPQVYYKLNGSWSAGVGGMYRFSIDPGKLAFDDFGSLSGAKVFAQYHAFKGFFLRAEGQYISWKPWDMKLTDPEFVDKTYVAAAGLGKTFNIARKLKGNAQTLYHLHWQGMDPYKSKIMIRVGLDLSLKKREAKPWEKKLKELERKRE